MSAFAAAALLITAATALWVTAAPLQASVWTVFLFAGPHNWMEARYFLARMPVRWAASRAFFLTAIPGVLLLAAAQAALYQFPGYLPVWNIALCLFTAALCSLRLRELRRAILPPWPVALAMAAFGLLSPYLFSLALIYLHPVVAFWFLDRQIRVTHPEWRKAWRATLAVVPLALAMIAAVSVSAPLLPASSAVPDAITQHAGADILQNVSSHMLVSLHVFLETLHYAIWVIAIPLLGMRDKPWRLSSIPLFTHRDGWPRLIQFILAGGAAAAILLWICFLLDYAATRQVYFTIAILHVLTEIPFLIRLR